MVKKSTSQAKTKTTKAAKITKKTVSVKTLKVVKNTKLVTEKSVNLAKVNLLSLVAFVILALVAGLLMAAANYEITVNYLTSDALAQSIVPAYRHFFEVDLRWVLVATLLLSALIPLLHLTSRKTAYQNYLKGKVLPWRWVEQGILQSITIALVALLVGYQDLVTLELFALVTLIISLISWCVEREYLTNKVVALKLHKFGVLVSAVVTIFLGLSLIATPIYGQIRASWYVYAAFATLVVSFGLNSINQYNQLRAHKAWKNYEVVERNYLVIGLVSKVALAVILVAGFYK